MADTSVAKKTFIRQRFRFWEEKALYQDEYGYKYFFWFGGMAQVVEYLPKQVLGPMFKP
jgi:hypothetical protein